MDTHGLDKLSEHTPLRDEVFRSLRNAILSGHFASGERLVEKELAEQWEISRTPIREAFRKLELEGLVTYAPRKGVIVVGVSSQDAVEIYTIRAVLEGLAARLAAHHIAHEDLVSLHTLLERMKDCIDKNKIDALIAFHSTFHNSIAKASKNSRLYHMIFCLREYVKNFSEIPCYLPSRLQHGWNEHKEILDAIDQRDEDRAEHAARYHIIQAKESLVRAVSTETGEL
ncbi:FCD domain-containing protein [candidate division KSB3 bacterium]|jgi:DNA-binding GntR family transcriptional regulator|uniref:FCD domain-containing protein n=1 Tax=candidate division KSB3 bacterium TaxID=2044937 RepID=A0A9D5JV73_9BACT|nr:FCD domain-containing protein [candidate division KSB3 bacterium]MBD3324760.1 FCD domain-containing protein [candidate division KSB3 bacterium]